MSRNPSLWFESFADPCVFLPLFPSRWADVLLIAPLSANTLAKLASGICDNLATSVVRAWDTDRPIVLAPAMNRYVIGRMYVSVGLNAREPHPQK